MTSHQFKNFRLRHQLPSSPSSATPKDSYAVKWAFCLAVIQLLAFITIFVIVVKAAPVVFGQIFAWLQNTSIMASDSLMAGIGIWIASFLLTFCFSVISIICSCELVEKFSRFVKAWLTAKAAKVDQEALGKDVANAV